jgi:hypothetical protein
MMLLATEGSTTEITPTTAQTVLKVAASDRPSCDDVTTPQLRSSAIHSLSRGILVASSTEIPSEDSTADFSDAESDAAVALFNCDCSACVSALRQLRSQPMLNNSKGHCWASMQQKLSPQEVKGVLENLEAEEAKSGVNQQN